MRVKAGRRDKDNVPDWVRTVAPILTRLKSTPSDVGTRGQSKAPKSTCKSLVNFQSVCKSEMAIGGP
jgi:hypothetical protein